jgi:hypothetical protein
VPSARAARPARAGAPGAAGGVVMTDLDIVDIEIDLGMLQRVIEARQAGVRRTVQTDDWCVEALRPGEPLCSCCAAALV